MRKNLLLTIFLTFFLSAFLVLEGSAAYPDELSEKIVDRGVMGYFVETTIANQMTASTVNFEGLKNPTAYIFVYLNGHDGKVYDPSSDDVITDWYEAIYDENGDTTTKCTYISVVMEQEYFETNFEYNTLTAIPLYRTDLYISAYDYCTESEVNVFLYTNYNAESGEYLSALNLESFDQQQLLETQGLWGDYVLKQYVGELDFFDAYGSMGIYEAQILKENIPTGRKSVYVACNTEDYEILVNENMCGMRGALYDYGITYEDQPVYLMKNLYTQTYSPELEFYKTDDILSWNVSQSSEQTDDNNQKEAGESVSEYTEKTDGEDYTKDETTQFGRFFAVVGVIIVASAIEVGYLFIRKRKKNEHTEC